MLLLPPVNRTLSGFLNIRFHLWNDDAKESYVSGELLSRPVAETHCSSLVL